MRHVLVPLDGTDLAAAILPDACRLAGPNGELILIRHVAGTQDTATGSPGGRQPAIDAAQIYLDTVAQTLRANGMQVRTLPLALGDAAVAIDEGVQLLGADMIAVSTHGRSAAERWRSGSVAWRALLRSSVPVLIRHVEQDRPFDYLGDTSRRRIMVPLDGSPLAESAITLAQGLADEWNASMWLVHVVSPTPADRNRAQDSSGTDDAATARAYLQEIARATPGEVSTSVLEGPTVQALAQAQKELQITDVVMTSQGRTAVSRSNVGSVLDDLIHAVRCPIIVIPLLAAIPIEDETQGTG